MGKFYQGKTGEACQGGHKFESSLGYIVKKDYALLLQDHYFS